MSKDFDEETFESEFVGHHVIVRLQSSKECIPCHVHSAILELGEFWYYRVIDSNGGILYLNLRDIISVEIVENQLSKQ